MLKAAARLNSIYGMCYEIYGNIKNTGICIPINCYFVLFVIPSSVQPSISLRINNIIQYLNTT